MFIIRIIWIGKTHDTYIRQGIDDYCARLKPFVSIECQQIKPAPSIDDIPRIRRIETEAVLKKMKPEHTNVILDGGSQEYTSVEFARWLESLKEVSTKQVNFVIGGAYGLDLELLKNCRKLSLSRMTFTHQMARLFLVEQIYRGFTIINGHNYHH